MRRFTGRSSWGTKRSGIWYRPTSFRAASQSNTQVAPAAPRSPCVDGETYAMRTEHRVGASIVASSLLFLGLGAAASAEPQSLGDVARRESDRRREQPQHRDASTPTR